TSLQCRSLRATLMSPPRPGMTAGARPLKGRPPSCCTCLMPGRMRLNMSTGKPAGKMHIDEVDTDASLVRRLLAAQFPQWADLPIEPVPSAGTDNALYRLGDDIVVRLPRVLGATGQVNKEHE